MRGRCRLGVGSPTWRRRASRKSTSQRNRPQSFVSKVETGERRIDPTELEKFAKLYGKPITFFLSG
jgi:hypothetical protein